MPEGAFWNNWKNTAIPASGSTISNPAASGAYSGFQGATTNTNVATDPYASDAFNMSPQERLNLSKLLKDAGYLKTATSRYNKALADAYFTAANDAAVEAARTGRTGLSIKDFLIENVSAGTGGTPVTEYPSISSPTDAISAINKVFNTELGRDATTDELKNLTNKLLAAQKKNPSRQTVKTVNGKRVVETVTGLDSTQFLIDEIKKTPTLKAEIDTRVKAAQSLTRQALEKTARANGLDLNKNFGSVVDTWVKRVDGGEDIDIFNNIIRSTAKLGLPDKVAGLLDNGVDLETVYSPYKRLMASTLEVAPDSISIDDPTLRMAIGPDKEMSLYDFQRSLRKDPRWQYTDQARQSVSEAALGVLRDFGFTG